MEVSKSQKVAKNTGYLFFRMILVLIVGLYTSRLVLQVLGFEDFGIYNVVGSVVIFLSFLKMALTNATYRYLAFEIGNGNQKQLNRIYSMAISSHILLAIILVLLMEIAGVWFINYHLNIPNSRISAANWVFQFSLLAFAINIIQTPFNSNIIAHERMDFYAIISIVEVSLKLAIVYILMIIAFDKLIFYSFLVFFVSIVVFLCYVVYCRRVFKECKYLWIWDRDIAKEFASYSGWSLIVNVADIVATQSMSIFFNIFMGVIANAAMGVMQQVVGHVSSFVSNFTQAVNPQIIKSYASKQYDYFMNLVMTSSKISCFLLLLISLPVISNIDYILELWLGDYPAETPIYIKIIIWNSLFEASQVSFLQAVHATGRIKTHQILMSIIKFAAIPVMYYVLWSGHSGSMMLIVWVAFTFLWCLVRLIYMHYLIHLSLSLYFNVVLLKIILITAFVMPLTFYASQLSDDKILNLLVSSFLSTTLLIISIWVFGLSSKEKELVLSMNYVKKFVNHFPFYKKGNN